MKTLNQVLDQARARAGLKSDRQLSYALGLTGPAVNLYRNRGVLPDDDVMLRLAALADIEPNAALLMLNVWRAKGPEAKAVYSDMLAKIGSTAAAALIALAFVPAGDSSASDKPLGASSEYYETCGWVE